ncbi:hypothetical protein SAY87_019649 [Trapa incisa]|uniref:Uncharacterized protein n=1 Tax=Trapa incisa TaxID=236973 RepID=A0AAN7K633_9MYRT|nr:hypothetical protein SAY87_019649 [Trapa incisa]
MKQTHLISFHVVAQNDRALEAEVRANSADVIICFTIILFAQFRFDSERFEHFLALFKHSMKRPSPNADGFP